MVLGSVAFGPVCGKSEHHGRECVVEPSGSGKEGGVTGRGTGQDISLMICPTDLLPLSGPTS
jgi:hypothetical protein